jgi:hypothetical protein
MTKTTRQYTNPRMTVTIDGWPYGRDLRTTATFTIEQHPTRGERGTGTTVDPKNGRISKPKTLTYASKARIVDGEDGRTYILELTASRTHLRVMMSDMQHQLEAIFPDDPRYTDLVALLA